MSIKSAGLPYYRIMCVETRALIAVIPAIDTTSAMCIGCSLFGPDVYVEKLYAVRTQSVTEKLLHDVQVESDLNKALQVQEN